jgi:hypothetical protein
MVIFFSWQATENGYLQMWRFVDGFWKTFLPDMGRKVITFKSFICQDNNDYKFIPESVCQRLHL